jgi:hypothetical protein
MKGAAGRDKLGARTVRQSQIADRGPTLSGFDQQAVQDILARRAPQLTARNVRF